MELFGFVLGFFNLHAFCFLTPEPPSALMLAGVAGRQRGRLGDTAVPGQGRDRRCGESAAASPASPGPALPARPHVCSPCGFIREKEDERGGRERRGAPAAFPGFQGSLEPLSEIIGRNGVWRERL